MNKEEWHGNKDWRVKQAEITGILQYSKTQNDSQVEDKPKLFNGDKVAVRMTISMWAGVSVIFK